MLLRQQRCGSLGAFKRWAQTSACLAQHSTEEVFPLWHMLLWQQRCGSAKWCSLDSEAAYCTQQCGRVSTHVEGIAQQQSTLRIMHKNGDEKDTWSLVLAKKYHYYYHSTTTLRLLHYLLLPLYCYYYANDVCGSPQKGSGSGNKAAVD